MLLFVRAESGGGGTIRSRDSRAVNLRLISTQAAAPL